MNEMIKIDFSGEQMKVSGRELHQILEVDTPYSKWFQRACTQTITDEDGNKITVVVFHEGRDYETLVGQKCPTNNPKNPWTTVTDHSLSMDMVKEICMMSRTEKGKRIREYFIQVEKDWNSPDKVMARALKMADATIAKLTAQIEADKPKTVFYDAISASANSISFGAMAKLAHNNGYDIGRNRFIDLLIKHGYVMRDNRNLVPTQRAINLGVLEPKESYYGENRTGIRITCVVTGKGQIYFMDFLYKIFKGQLGA